MLSMFINQSKPYIILYSSGVYKNTTEQGQYWISEVESTDTYTSIQ